MYILSALLLIASFFCAYRAATYPGWKIFALLGGANGLAVLAHNTNVLFAVVALVTLLFSRRILEKRDLVRCALAYALTSFIIVVAGYAIAIRTVGLKTPRGMYDWLTGYAQSGNWGGWEVSNLPKAVIGAGRALIGGHFAFALDPLRDLATKSFPGKSLREELFLVRHFDQGLAGFLLTLVVVAALCLLLSATGWLRYRRLGEREKTLAVLCLSWLMPYTLFFTWWEPANIEFWIVPWIPLAVLLALPLSTYEPGIQRRFVLGSVFLLVSILFTVNLIGSVWPQHDPEDDYWRVRSDWYARNTTPSELVISYGPLWSRYLRYFGQAKVIDVEEDVFKKHGDTKGALVDLRRRMDTVPHTTRVLVSSEAFYPASDKFSCCPSNEQREQASALRNSFLGHTRIVHRGTLERVRILDSDK
ncbi:hypothetical protein BH23ACT11_BH23ACT11_01200 [soil metagenome]